MPMISSLSIYRTRLCLLAAAFVATASLLAAQGCAARKSDAAPTVTTSAIKPGPTPPDMQNRVQRRDPQRPTGPPP